MSINRNQLGRGPAKVVYSGATFYTRDDLVLRHSPIWKPLLTSAYGEVDKTKSDLMIRIPLRLWGAYENLSIIFPSYAMNPNAGTSVYGTSDTALVITGKNGDQITYANAQVTKLSDLYLGVDSDLFAADLEFMAIIKNNANPEDANAYYTVATGQAYADNAFAKTNFKRVRFTGTWGSQAGFTSFAPQKGINLSWNLNLKPLPCDGLGTVDYTVDDMVATAKCIPVGPTLAQLEGGAAAQGFAHGTLLSAVAGADLTLAGSGISIVLKNAGLIDHGYVFGIEPLRVGEVAWVTTRGFSAGVPAAVATAS